jgi:hypothetical protein
MAASESEPEWHRSCRATFSFLQPLHGRDRLESTSSTSSGVLMRDSEGVSAGSMLVPATRKEGQAQPQTAPTRHGTESYFSTVESKPTSWFGLTTPIVVVPPSPPAFAQSSEDKTQTKRVLRHAQGELRKEVEYSGYNILVVEG